MNFFVVRNTQNKYLTNCKPTGKTYPQVYQSRSGWSDDMEQAKIFTTKGAATRSANDNAECDYDVIRVEIEIKETVSSYQFYKDVHLIWKNTGPNSIDIEAVTEFGTYTISFDAPTAGGGINLWLAGDDVDRFSVFYSVREAKEEADFHFNELKNDRS